MGDAADDAREREELAFIGESYWPGLYDDPISRGQKMGEIAENRIGKIINNAANLKNIPIPRLKIVKVKILDPVYSQVFGEDIRVVKNCLQYEHEYWLQGQYRKERHVTTKFMIDKKGIFLTGFIPRLKEFGDKNNFLIQVDDPVWADTIIKPKGDPKVGNIVFRNDQLILFNKAFNHARGVLLAPPGIGKTIISIAIISVLEANKYKTLFLCNEKTLFYQTIKELRDNSFDPAIIGDGRKDPYAPITVAMIQTFAKENPEDYGYYFDGVIIDETDIGMELGGQYHKVLSNMIAFYRYGVSATLPPKPYGKLCLEGLIGPVIGQMPIEEGIELGLLAKPKITIVRSKLDFDLKDVRNYDEVYQKGIVHNRSRNRLILSTTDDRIQKGKTVLIFVSKIEHGKILEGLANLFFGFYVPFIFGNVAGEERSRLKTKMQNKQVKCIIADDVWKRGINIPSLNVVILAGCGKSWRDLEQKIGRGLRRDEGSEKTEVEIVDIFDPSNYHLVNHFGERISFYCEKGWL